MGLTDLPSQLPDSLKKEEDNLCDFFQYIVQTKTEDRDLRINEKTGSKSHDKQDSKQCNGLSLFLNNVLCISYYFTMISNLFQFLPHLHISFYIYFTYTFT